MKQMIRFRWLGALMMSVVLWASSVAWADTKALATITVPRGNSVVERVTQVIFETTTPGVPLVLVTVEGEKAEWWVQPLAKAIAPGRYAVAAHIGNSKTPQGTPFQVTVLIVPSERDANLITEQQVFTQLPAGLAMSKPLRVLRKLDGETTIEPVSTPTHATAEVQAGVAAIRLDNRAGVARRQEVHGMLRGEVDPVILVRAASDSMWWVQEGVQRNAAGEFTAVVRFGNEKTPAGSEFHLLALTPRSSSEAALFKFGESLKELPENA
ncbi:MAG: hypothetical protein HYV60_10350, partial [Planctomycetia bacterium]|nr:hypothetical protein [Planctomycetia bacterium]